MFRLPTGLSAIALLCLLLLQGHLLAIAVLIVCTAGCVAIDLKSWPRRRGLAAS